LIRKAEESAILILYEIDNREMDKGMKQKFQTMMYRLSSKMQQYMVGRNGADELGRFVSLLTWIFLILSLFTKWKICYWIGILLIAYSYFRMFSRNIPKRYAENQKFLTLRYKAVAKWNLLKKHTAESKTYRFFKCPKCSQKVRVPKGRGKICIICPKCKAEFVKRS